MAAFLIAGVFSAIYPSGGFFSLQGCSLPYIRVAAFLIAGVFSAIYPSGGFFS